MKAAVCRVFGEPLVIEEIQIAAPGPGELRVTMAACAICQSDIHYLEGAWGGTLPTVYGHEAAGVVAEVGAGAEGFAENWDETAEGLYAASVPINNGAGTSIAALTTLVPRSRVTPERRETIVACLREQGRRLSELVDWLPAYSARGSTAP